MRLLTTILMLALLVSPSWAEDIQLIADVNPPVVPVGSDAVLTITVKGKFRRNASPELPSLEAFDIYESGTSQSIQMFNGAMTSSLTFTYRMTARKEGKYDIAPITIKLGNDVYTANAVSVEVTPAQSGVSGPGTRAVPPSAMRSGAAKDQSIFINAVVDRDTVYVNQQVTWTLGYYTDGRLNLLRSPNYTPPEVEGFWLEELPPQNQYYTTIKGRRYLVNEIKKGLFPTAPGIYTIGEATVEVFIDDFESRDVHDIFNRPFGRRGGRSQALLTDSITVVVLPLPEAGKPIGFTGAVATDLKLSLAADKQSVAVGEPINIKLEINGRGNIQTVIPPDLGELDAFKVYDSKSETNAFKKNYVVSGRKTYEYVVVPRDAGEHSIGPLTLHYFDPESGAYTTAQTLAVPVTVTPGSDEDGRRVVYAGTGDNVDVINRDIAFIRPVPAVATVAQSSWFSNPLVVGLHALPLLALMVSAVAERRRRRLRDDKTWARASRARRVADRALDVAAKRLGAGDVSAAVSGAGSALTTYFADKMDAAPAGLTSDEICEFLERCNVGDESVNSARELLARADALRFGATGLDRDAATLLVSHIRTAIASIDAEVRS